MSLKNVIGNFFNRISQAITVLSNGFRRLCLKIKGCYARDKLRTYELSFRITNYKCDKCNGRLMRSGKYYDDKIVYKCLDCGKVHEAYKNNVIGRFKTMR